MSWSEIFKVNSNMKRPLNKQIQDMYCKSSYLFTGNATFTPEANGYYKIICVGGSGASTVYLTGGGTGQFTEYAARIGASGGVAIKTLELNTTDSYSITVGSTSAFDSVLSASSGTATTNVSNLGTGGSATGGDFNYTGLSGKYSTARLTSTSYAAVDGVSVGVFIPELSRGFSYGFSSYTATSGLGICGYGCSSGLIIGSGAPDRSATSGCVIIVPVELEI